MATKSGRSPTGRTDHLSDAWHVMLRQACVTAKREAQNGVWTVSGNYADNLGTIAMQEVANRTGLSVVPVGETDYHAATCFSPTQGIEAGTGETVKHGSTAKPRKPGGEAMRPNTVTNARDGTE